MTSWAPPGYSLAVAVGCSTLGAIGLASLAAELGSTPEIGPAYSLLVLTLVLAIPPSVRSVASLAVRRWRFACRRVSEPSVFQAMVAGDAGRLNGRVLVPVGVGELVQEGHVAAHQLS